jgi:hypothetical protein
MESIEQSILKLKQHEAISDDHLESITTLGELLSRLPVEISIGTILVLATVKKHNYFGQDEKLIVSRYFEYWDLCSQQLLL